MPALSFKIATPIIVAGLFVMVSFIALNYNNLNATFYIIFAFLAIYVFLFGFATGQNFTVPVKKLLKRANELSEGDLKSRFYLEGKDELGQLSRVFNRIADQLEESSRENENTRKSVGIKVEAETQSLKEVIEALERKVQNRTIESQKMASDLQKLRDNTKAKDMELAELRRQVAEVKDGVKKRPVKNKKEEMPDGNPPPNPM